MPRSAPSTTPSPLTSPVQQMSAQSPLASAAQMPSHCILQQNGSTAQTVAQQAPSSQPGVPLGEAMQHTLPPGMPQTLHGSAQ